jgi:hypothetical protein
MLSLIENSIDRAEMYKVTIKSIKINNGGFNKLQKLNSNVYLNPTKIEPTRDRY